MYAFLMLKQQYLRLFLATIAKKRRNVSIQIVGVKVLLQSILCYQLNPLITRYILKRLINLSRLSLIINTYFIKIIFASFSRTYSSYILFIIRDLISLITACFYLGLYLLLLMASLYVHRIEILLILEVGSTALALFQVSSIRIANNADVIMLTSALLRAWNA